MKSTERRGRDGFTSKSVPERGKRERSESASRRIIELSSDVSRPRRFFSGGIPMGDHQNTHAAKMTTMAPSATTIFARPSREEGGKRRIKWSRSLDLAKYA